MQEDFKDIVPTSTPAEIALDITSFVISAVPWIGGPVSNVLSGVSFGRKLARVREVLVGLAEDLKKFRSIDSEAYVNSDEFEELLEHTLKKASEERSDEKRRLYRSFLSDVVKVPGKSYDEQIFFLRTIEQLQPDHIQLLRALTQQPTKDPGMMGSPGQTLGNRLPQLGKEHISDLVNQLNDLRITNLKNLNTMMTGYGAEDLQHSITPYGQRLLQFLLKA